MGIPLLRIEDENFIVQLLENQLPGTWLYLLCTSSQLLPSDGSLGVIMYLCIEFPSHMCEGCTHAAFKVQNPSPRAAPQHVFECSCIDLVQGYKDGNTKFFLRIYFVRFPKKEP